MTILRLTDGIVTANLIWHSDTNRAYMLQRDGWAPQVAPLRPGGAGGRGAYADVVEEIGVLVCGDTEAAVLANHARLAGLLDQARRWGLGQGSGTLPVRLEYQPDGAAAVRVATVLGPAAGDQSGVGGPISYHADVRARALPVRLRLRRRGRWLRQTAEAQVSGAATAVGLVAGITLADHPVVSPLDALYLRGFTAATTPQVSAGYLCVAGRTTDAIQIVELTGAAGHPATFTAVADAANRPLNTFNVLRYTPVGTGLVESGRLSVGDALHSSPLAILACVRNNSAARTWQVRANLHGYGYTASTPERPVDGSTLQPRIVRLGIVRHPFLWNAISLSARVDSISGGPTLDIDWIAVVALHDATSRVIQHDAVDIATMPAGFVDMAVLIEPRDRLVPQLRFEGSGVGAGFRGATYHDPIDLETVGTIVRVAWLATRGAHWRYTDVSNNVLSLTPTVERQPAYLVPQ